MKRVVFSRDLTLLRRRRRELARPHPHPVGAFRQFVGALRNMQHHRLRTAAAAGKATPNWRLAPMKFSRRSPVSVAKRSAAVGTCLGDRNSPGRTKIEAGDLAALNSLVSTRVLVAPPGGVISALTMGPVLASRQTLILSFSLGSSASYTLVTKPLTVSFPGGLVEPLSSSSRCGVNCAHSPCTATLPITANPANRQTALCFDLQPPNSLLA